MITLFAIFFFILQFTKTRGEGYMILYAYLIWGGARADESEKVSEKRA